MAPKKKGRQPKPKAEAKAVDPGKKIGALPITGDECAFLIQALGQLPMKGTPETLNQVLPLVNGLRQKLMQVGLALGVFQVQEQPQQPQPPASEEPAAKES